MGVWHRGQGKSVRRGIPKCHLRRHRKSLEGMREWRPDAGVVATKEDACGEDWVWNLTSSEPMKDASKVVF